MSTMKAANLKMSGFLWSEFILEFGPFRQEKKQDKTRQVLKAQVRILRVKSESE